MEEPIVAKFVCLADPLNSGDQKKQNHVHQVDWIKFRARPSRAKGPLEAAPKIELVTKPLNQEQTTVVGEGF
jgi:hypothetical protein